MTIFERVYGVLKEENADAVLISNQCNIRYITGYTGDTGYVYLSRNKAILFTDFRYVFQAKAEAKECEVYDIADEGYYKAIAAAAKEDGTKTMLFEGAEVLFSFYERLRKECDGIELAAIGDELAELRMVKTPYELEQIKMAEHIGDLAFADILEYLKPGVTELEIAARLEFSMKCHGAEGLSFSSIVASGVNSSMCHAIPGRKKIESGDFVTMDFGCTYNGYCSDMTRTVVVGKASEKQKHIYNTVLTAQLAVLDRLKAGMNGNEIDKIARDIINEAGYEGCFGHGLGHSVGLFIHESPRASAFYTKPVGENMTLTVEPGIYVQDFGGVRIEDLVVVKKDGCENFTHSPKELIEL